MDDASEGFAEAEAASALMKAAGELDIAEAFVAYTRIRAGTCYEWPLIGFDTRTQRWWLFQKASGGVPRWQVDRMGEAARLVTTFIQLYLNDQPQKRSWRMQSSVMNFLRHHQQVALDPEGWDSDPDLLGTPGGVVDLRTGEMRPGRPTDRISKCTAVSPAPAGETPGRWLKFLAEAHSDDAAVIGALQVFGGYSLTGRNRDHTFLALVGAGGAGVSTFTDTLTRLAGDYAKATSSETFTATAGERHPADLAALAGVRLVVAPEVERGRRWAESRLKGFVAGDPISARVMRGDPFEFRPVGKLIVTSNALPSIGTVDRAMRRRLLIIRFDQVPANPQRDLLERLIADEGPAILRWFIDGSVCWYRDGLHVPERMRAATDDYLEVEDTFTEWLGECVSLEVDESETASGLFRSWRGFCERRNEAAGTQKAFGHVMRAHGIQTKDKVLDVESGRRMRGYQGLRLK